PLGKTERGCGSSRSPVRWRANLTPISDVSAPMIPTFGSLRSKTAKAAISSQKRSPT
ncbi:hypothetical protein LTR94_037656, partial [Friedmanniomyces endolithicus]